MSSSKSSVGEEREGAGRESSDDSPMDVKEVDGSEEPPEEPVFCVLILYK